MPGSSVHHWLAPLAQGASAPYTPAYKPDGLAWMNAPQALHAHDHRHCIDDALSRAETVCAERGARMTPLRRRVLELVWDSHAPIGAYAIMDLLRAADDRAAAPPTVYRALEFLLDQGLVHKIESLNAFVGCDRPEERHISQFLICTSCKAAVELNDPAITQAVEASAQQSGFSLNRLTIEAQGLCAACRAGREAA
jgi:Fur family zinc uptake transcriptional regulator